MFWIIDFNSRKIRIKIAFVKFFLLTVLHYTVSHFLFAELSLVLRTFGPEKYH
jgi:hypothetical protein